jgi:hypothetical protein
MVFALVALLCLLSLTPLCAGCPRHHFRRFFHRHLRQSAWRGFSRYKAESSYYCVVALLLDVASTSVQPLARTDKRHFIAAGEYLASAAPNERVIEAVINRDGSFGFDIGPGATPLSYYTTSPRVAGYHNLAATHVHNFAETIIKMAERDLRNDGNLSQSTELLVGVLNASRIVCFGFVANGCPQSFIAATSEGPLGDIVHIPNAAPVLFSQNVTSLAPSTDPRNHFCGTRLLTPHQDRRYGCREILRRPQVSN